MLFKRLLVVTAVAAVLSTTACSKDSATDPLAYAPENTPYLIANVEPVPTAATDVWLKSAEQMMPMYETMLDRMVADVPADKADELGVRIIKAARDELKGKFNRAGLESIGLTMSSRSAIYGIGMIPVMRLELGDPDAFKAFVARMETKVGEKLTTAKVGDQDYWSAAPADDKLQLIMAVQAKHLVLTIAPKVVDAGVLESLLGLTLPKSSVLDAKSLPAFNKQRGYLPYGSGYIDTTKLFNVVFGERSPAEKAFLDALGEKNPLDGVSAVCKAEHLAIAAQVPRLSFGYTELDAKSMSLRYVVETAPAIGAELSKLPVKVPSLDGHGEGLFDVGFGINLNAFVSFVNAKSAAVAAAPYQCESLASLNEAFEQARTSVSNPGVFMAAAAFNGMYASLSKLETPEGAAPVLEGKLALSSDNPASLLSMIASFAPPVASLSLKPNEAPVALPADALPPGTPASFVALSDKALGLSIGAGQEASLQAFLSAIPSEPSPLLYYGVDGAGMATFFDLMLKQSEDALAAAEAEAADPSVAAIEDAIDDEMASDDTDSEESADDSVAAASNIAELRTAVDSMKTMRDIYTKTIKRADVSFNATERGLEVEYAVQMK